MRKRITLAACVVQASIITLSQSPCIRNRRRPFNQLIGRSTNQRTLPRPPWDDLRLETSGSIPSNRDIALGAVLS